MLLTLKITLLVVKPAELLEHLCMIGISVEDFSVCDLGRVIL
jgi:hypothetical protein